MINKNIFEFPIHYTNPILKIAIGWGVHETAADECKFAGIRKALIVTSGLKGTGIIEEMNQILINGGVATAIYDKVTSNPKDYEVMAAYDVFKEAECDGVVSIGGGSSHDCGKGVRAVAANDGTFVGELALYIEPPWMEQMEKFKPATIPQICVNTTAGTGAEITFVGAITNTKKRVKQLVSVPGINPTAALIDPLLVRMMPRNIAAWTGFDALSHGFEGYLSRTECEYTKALNERTMSLVAENLREFAYNRMNQKACEKMCWASSMGGVGIQLGAGAGILHGLSHQFSALTGCQHGLANAVMTLGLERYNQPSCAEKFAKMAAMMGAETGGLTRLEAADKWFEEIEKLLKDLGIRSGYLNEQFGLEKKDLDHIVTLYSKDWCMQGNPREFNYGECISLLESML